MEHRNYIHINASGVEIDVIGDTPDGAKMLFNEVLDRQEDVCALMLAVGPDYSDAEGEPDEKEE